MLELQKKRLLRNVEVIRIPSGELITLAKNSDVEVTQQLGNSGTIKYQNNLYLLTSENLDAIGQTSIELEKLPKGASDQQILDFAWRQLATCYDPEIPVDIVSLGLIYGIKIVHLLDNTKQLHIKMTLTSPTCGIGEVIAKDAQIKLEQIADIDKVVIQLVLTPVWTRDMMSDDAKLQLGIF